VPGFPAQTCELKMDSPRTYFLLLVALLVLSFGIAADLQPQYTALRSSRANGDVFKILLGDSRQIFANAFYVKADAYYHSGFYPTIFDNNEAFKTAHMAEDTGAVSSKNHGEEENFMGAPRDWIDAFGRHFFPYRHTHLDAGGPRGDLSSSENVDEILPWLKLSTDLDPQNVQNYTVTAYWLRERMRRTEEAHEILLEGLRENPGSCDILFELGRLYAESDHDTNRAEHVWTAAARNWKPIKGSGDEVAANDFIYEKITTQLGETERNAGHWQAAIDWFEKSKMVSHTPGSVQAQIDEIKKQMSKPSALLFPGCRQLRFVFPVAV
jgi:tetratricopeptide (TPR) repeat protein